MIDRHAPDADWAHFCDRDFFEKPTPNAGNRRQKLDIAHGRLTPHTQPSSGQINASTHLTM